MPAIDRNRFWKMFGVVILALFGLQAGAQGASKVAVIDGGDGFPQSPGEIWCAFLNDNAYECTLFPRSGPTSALTPFAVVINMSDEWADSGHLLAAFMASGKGVITWGRAPGALGIATDPIVQAWVGTNAASFGSGLVKTTAGDSLLGNISSGTIITNSGKFGAQALEDTSGHGQAKVLARHSSGTGTIALLRNRWTGQSVYFSDAFFLDDVQSQILLRAVAELSVRTIPATSSWTLIVFAALVAISASILIKRNCNYRRGGPSFALAKGGVAMTNSVCSQRSRRICAHLRNLRTVPSFFDSNLSLFSRLLSMCPLRPLWMVPVVSTSL